MIKLTNKKSNFVFFGQTFEATPQDLIDLLGVPQYFSNTGENKTNFGWTCELEDGTIFSIYDWKYYKSLDLNVPITWNVGGKDITTTRKGCEVIKKILNKK